MAGDGKNKGRAASAASASSASRTWSQGAGGGIRASIGTKLTLATLVVLVLVSVILYRELTRRERQSLLASKETAATMVADLFAASLSAPLDFADNDAVKTELD